MNNNDIQKQLAKLRRNKKLLWLGILFLVLIILWILVSIFATTKTSSISKEQIELSKSFVPRLESKVFDEILAKRAFSDEELAYFAVFVIDKDDVRSEGKIVDIMSIPEEDQEFVEILGDEMNPASSSVTTETSLEATGSSLQESSSSSTEINTNSSTTTPFIEFMKANY